MHNILLSMEQNNIILCWHRLTDQQGMYTYGNDYYQRYNARTTLQSDLSKWMTVGFRSAFSRSVKDTPNSATFANANILHILAQRRPTQPLFNPDGNYSIGSYVTAFSEGGRIHTVTDDGTLTGEIIIKPIEGWDITANYSFTGLYSNRLTHLKTIYHVLPSGKLAVLMVHRQTQSTEDLILMNVMCSTVLQVMKNSW